MAKSSYTRLKECENDLTIDFLNSLGKGYSPFNTTFELQDDPKALKIFANLLFLGLKTGKVLVYDLSIKIELSFFNSEHHLSFLAFDWENSLIITPGHNGNVHYWTLEGKLDSKTSTLHQSKLNQGLYCNSSLYLADVLGNISVNGPKNAGLVKGHEGKVSCMEVLSVLATSGEDCCIRIWSLNLSLIHCFKVTKPAKKICFVSGEKLVSGGRNSEFIVWDLIKFQSVQKIESSDMGILCFAADPNINLFLGGTQTGQVDIYSSTTKIHEDSFNAHFSEIKCIGLNSTGSLLVTAGKEKTVKIWQIYKEFPKEKLLQGHLEEIVCMVLDENNQELHSADTSGYYIKWDLSLQKQIFELKAHSSTITGILLTPKNTLTISHDQFIKKWENNNLIQSISFHEILLSICSANDLIFVGCRNGGILILNHQLERKGILLGHWNSVTTLVNFNDFLLSGSHDQTIQIWDLTTLTSVYKYKAHDSSIKKIKVHPNSKSFLSYACDRTFKYWYSGFPPSEVSLPSTPSNIISLAYVQNGQFFYTGDKKGKVCVYCSRDLVNLIELEFGEIIHEILEFKSDKSVILAVGKKIIIKRELMSQTGILTYPNCHGFLYFQYLSSMLKGKNLSFKQNYKDVIIMPMKINVLHALVYINDYENLKIALESSTKFLKSCGKTPLKLALDRGSYQCVDIILKYVPMMQKTTNPKIFCTIEDDIYEIFALQLKNLPLLLSYAFPVVKNNNLPNLANINRSKNFLSELPGINPINFNLTGNQNSIEFRVSLFKIPLELGSKKCLLVLNNIFKSENTEIFNQKLIQSILEYLYYQSFSILLFFNILNLISIFILIIFKIFEDSTIYSYLVLTINGLNFIFELSQMVQNFGYYIGDIWNIIDQIRILSSCLAALLLILGTDKWITQEALSVALLFSMFRLISIFRLFSGTRYMIRMVFQVILDISSFLLLLFFTTFTLAFSFFVLKPEAGVYSTFTQIYLMNFGEFEYEQLAGNDLYSSGLFYVALFINPLVMMNLLIATMENTYSKIQENLLISNYREIASLTIEASSIMFWKRKQEKKYFLQTCGVREQLGVSSTLTNKLKKLKKLADIIKKTQTTTLKKIDEIIQKTQLSTN